MVSPSSLHRHVGTILLILSCMFIAAWCNQENEVQSEYNICNPDTYFINPSRVFLEGPSDANKFGQSTTVYVNWTRPRHNPLRDFGCLMLFKTNHRSKIRVDAVGQDFRYPSCNSPKAFAAGQDEIDSCVPGCVYIKLVDSDYKEETMKLVTTTTSLQTYPAYTSQSSKLHIVACDKGLDEIKEPVNMRLRLTTVLKHRQIQGYVGVTTLSSQTLTSPYFPERYIQNSEEYTYSFSGIPGSGASVIAVTFDDWDLSQFSKIVFKVDGRDTYLSGLDPRPYFIANSPTMQMTFNTGQPLVAGGYSRFNGFKAVAKFYRRADDVPHYLTDCDKIIDDGPGGVIVQNSFGDGRARDCVWIIKPSKDFSSLYLKVVSYSQGWGTWHENSLEVRGGVTSDAPQNMFLRPSSNMPLPDYGGQTSSKGFYIRFKGEAADGQSVVISYSQFRMECNPRYEYDTYFKCGNGRCIDKALRCDTYDHCGDNTDELYCSSDGANEVNKHEGGHNYNYSISVGVIIPMVVVVFLIIVICLLVIFFKRFRRLRQSNANRGSSGSGLLGGSGGRNPRNGERDGERGQRRGRDRRRRHRGNRSSHPGYLYPDYPPSYDEALVSTPVDMLNMAFPWSQSDLALGQPPSYEDAMLEASESSPDGPPYDNSNAQQNNNNNNNSNTSSNNHNDNSRQSRSGSVPSISTTTASGVYPGLHISRLTAASTNDILVDGQSRQRQGISAPSNLNSDMILDPNLAPGAYVSSSSSSEASETEMPMDMSSSSESSTDNEQGFIPSGGSQTSHNVHADDHNQPHNHYQHHQQQEQLQQLSTYSSRRSSSASTMCANPTVSANDNENKIGQEDQEQPIVVKTKDTSVRKNEDPSKVLEGSKDDKEGRGLQAGDTQNITDSNDHFESSSPENESSDRHGRNSYASINENESSCSAANDRNQQETKRRGARKRHSRQRSRNSNRSAIMDESHPSVTGQIHRGHVQEMSYGDNAEENVDLPSFSERRDRLRRKDVVKSQSCFNLSVGGDDSSFYQTDGHPVSVNDKRFSYAGAGDATVHSHNRKHLQLPLSLQLVRDRESERLGSFDAVKYGGGNNTTGAGVTSRRGATSQDSLESVLEEERTSDRPNIPTTSDMFNPNFSYDPLSKSCSSNPPTTRDFSKDSNALNENRLELMNQSLKASRDTLESPPNPDFPNRRHTILQKIPNRQQSDSVSRCRPESSHGSSHSLPTDRLDSSKHDVLITNNPQKTINTSDTSFSGVEKSQMRGNLPDQNNGRNHPSMVQQAVAHQSQRGHKQSQSTDLGAKGRYRSHIPPAMSSTEIANIYAKRQSLESLEERLSGERPGRLNRPKSAGDGRHHHAPQLQPRTQNSKPAHYMPKERFNHLEMTYQGPNLSNLKDSHLQLSARRLEETSMPLQKKPPSKVPDDSFARKSRGKPDPDNFGIMKDTPITFDVAAEKVAVFNDINCPGISQATASVPGVTQPHRISREDLNQHVAKNPSQNYDSPGSSSHVNADQSENPEGSLYKAKAQGSHHTLPLSGHTVKSQPDKYNDKPARSRNSQNDRFVHYPKQSTSQPPVPRVQKKKAVNEGFRGRQERPTEGQTTTGSELNGRDDSVTSCHMDMYRPGHRGFGSRPATRSSMYTDKNQSPRPELNANGQYREQLKAISGHSFGSAEQNANFPVNYLLLQEDKDEMDIYV